MTVWRRPVERKKVPNPVCSLKILPHYQSVCTVNYTLIVKSAIKSHLWDKKLHFSFTVPFPLASKFELQRRLTTMRTWPLLLLLLPTVLAIEVP